jgi:hypothetical protein
VLLVAFVLASVPQAWWLLCMLDYFEEQARRSCKTSEFLPPQQAAQRTALQEQLRKYHGERLGGPTS